MRRAGLALALGLAILVTGVLLHRGGWLPFVAPSARRFPVRGIDVSHHQGPIDWAAVRGAGVAFAFIKASEGADRRDTRFEANWSDAGSAGIARGAYHFFTFCTPGEPQARNFLSAVPASQAELPPAADVEFTGNCLGWESIEQIREELAVFLAQVEASAGRRPVIYLTRASYDRIVAGHFPGYRLWVRHEFLEPSERRYGPWDFWQFADDGRIPGVPKPVDLDVFRGSREDFERLIARSTPPGA